MIGQCSDLIPEERVGGWKSCRGVRQGNKLRNTCKGKQHAKWKKRRKKKSPESDSTWQLNHIPILWNVITGRPEQVSQTWISNYIPKVFCDVITYPYPTCLLLSYYAPYGELIFKTAVTPLLTYWRFCSLMQRYWYHPLSDHLLYTMVICTLRKCDLY